jgi:hypothetical protein
LYNFRENGAFAGHSINISKTGSPEEGALELLFKDYTGGSFQTEPLNLGDPVGEEKW